jgi:hypothetical protein
MPPSCSLLLRKASAYGVVSRPLAIQAQYTGTIPPTLLDLAMHKPRRELLAPPLLLLLLLLLPTIIMSSGPVTPLTTLSQFRRCFLSAKKRKLCQLRALLNPRHPSHRPRLMLLLVLLRRQRVLRQPLHHGWSEHLRWKATKQLPPYTY